ncbi:hypothetical protein key_069 [Erwinia phage KEY]|uniref:Uncharacterized protein n=1 Tax=Erwinia phage KEY TaxID=2821255 RepID=A0AAE7WCH8_9CAUD|nr:hypothetical protein key_069 [Erwinia phage KEY]
MPVSKNKRKNGKVASRNLTIETLNTRLAGVNKLLGLLSKATNGRIVADKDRALRLAMSKGL